MIVNLGITITTALAGACAGRKLKLPAAFMTGSMIAVIIMNFFVGRAYCPATAKPYVQVIAGAFIAMSITRQTVRDMKLIIKPLLAYLGCLIVWALFCGLVMHTLGGLDKVTAFLSCVPGGLTDISLLSMDMGANTPQVTTLQTLRMIMAVGAFPLLTRNYVARFGHRFEWPKAGQAPAAGERPSGPDSGINIKTPQNMFISMAIAAAGAYLGMLAGIPSAAMTGAMIAAAGWNVLTGRVFIPGELRKVTQIVAGSIVGAMVTRADIEGLVSMIIPFMIIVEEYVIFDFVIAPVLARIFRMDLLTMILACTPAGASDMALIAGDMGGEISDVAVFHVVRLCMVLTVFPALIQWIAA